MRYGNKSVVSRVLPDKDMPHTKDGKTVDVYEILNDSYFGYEFVSAFEVIKYRKEHE